MILTGKEIISQHARNRINIKPFELSNITTNSYDITLGDKLIYYTESVLDPKKLNKFIEIIIPEEGFVIGKGCFYLGHSQEVIGSDYFVPIVHAKSGIARLGLFVHVTADLIDLGYHGNITFQLYATLPIKVYKNMKIGQMSFWTPTGEIDLYRGKYQGGIGPQVSKSFKDYNGLKIGSGRRSKIWHRNLLFRLKVLYLNLLKRSSL